MKNRVYWLVRYTEYLITMNDIVERLKEFIENEMRSCSMDIGGITPEYVQRAWGGRVAIEDINTAFEELKRSDDLLCIGK